MYLLITHGPKRELQEKLENILNWIKIKTQHITTSGVQISTMQTYAYVWIEGRLQINNLSFDLKKKKRRKRKSKLNPNQVEEENNKDKGKNEWNLKEKCYREKSINLKWFFGTTNKIDKLLASQI